MTLLQDFEPLVAADDVAGALVPDDGVDVAEFLYGVQQLLVLRVSRL